MLASSAVFAQVESNLRAKKVRVSRDTQVLDTQMILVGSVIVEGVGDSEFHVNPSKSSIVFNRDGGDSVRVRYRVIDVREFEPKRRKDPALRMLYQTENPFSYVPQSEKFFSNEDDLNTVGNISRGIGFGNKQDVVVNSNLNLRISGRINQKVDVLAAVSDQNNPIQPEGNTQQLQDFDRVFIQLSMDSSSLTVGDFQMLRPPGSYFMNYNKKSRGLQASHRMVYGKGHLTLQGEGAVSRGRFSRNTFQGLEGNQGPYRLSGSNGETFIIVISGTEKVYLDGNLMQRGEQNDYVIDYNAGEITFTPNRLITQYSRIVVEFQYSDRNYARSVVHVNGIYEHDRWSLNANYYTEQDNKNQPFQQSLDGYDSLTNLNAREVLAEAGNVSQAYIQRVIPTNTFNVNRIMYVQRDTLGETIYKYTETPGEDSVFYDVTFSYVGSGKGNYKQKRTNANGKVFEFIPPIAGIPQGDYAPVEVLVTPKRRQMATLGGSFKITDRNLISFEMATTVNDLNTFSPIGTDNNQGFGAFVNYEGSHLPVTSDWNLKSAVSYEFIDKRFQYIERYRNVEFDRIWNRQLQNPDNKITTRYNENVIRSKFELTKKKNLALDYDFSMYDRVGLSTGYQHKGKFTYRNKKNDMVVTGERVGTGTPLQLLGTGLESDSGTGVVQVLRNQFTGYSANYSRKMKWFVVGGGYSDEGSSYRSNESDSLYQSSYRFTTYHGFVQNRDSSKVTYRLGYDERVDYQPLKGKMATYTVGRNYQVLSGWKGKKNGEVRLTGTYRELQYQDTFATEFKPENTLQGRLEFNFNALKKVVRTSIFYQVATGQEQRREFSYIRVGDGNGTYIWKDYDSNGVQSLNEFELASSLDANRANFIRQFLPTQQFIRSYSNRFNHSIRINPAVVWRAKDKGVKRFVGRFSDLNTVRIEKKVTNNNYATFLNPFNLQVEDTALVSTTTAIRNALFFNQSDPTYGFDINYLRSASKSLLITGFDSRNAIEWGLKGRWNVTRSWSLIAEGISGNHSYSSEFLTDRSFNYDFYSLEPRLVYQYKQSVRVSAIYKRYDAQNAINLGGEKAVNDEFSLEFRWITVNRGNLRSSIGYVDIKYDGDPNKPLTYELLQGLQNGVNYKWTLQAEYRFPNNIQILLNYDGRKSQLSDAIHAGRVQARYLF